MKKMMFLLLIIVTTHLAADFRIIEDRGELTVTANGEISQEQVKLENETYIKLVTEDANFSGIVGQALLPTYTQLINLPAQGNYRIENLQYNTEIVDLDYKLLPSGEQRDFDEKYYQNNDFMPNQIVTVGSPALMRGVRFSQVAINTVQYNPVSNQIKVFSNISFDLEMDRSDARNALQSRKNLSGKAFDNIYKSNLWGWEEERNLEVEPELYLFICPDNIVESLEPLTAWKRQLGFKTVVTGLSEAGNTNTSIKNYIQTAYDEWETAPTYVVLVGDESGPISVPAFFEPGFLSPLNVTDHNYTLLEGDDYFPDVMIGRLTCRSEMQLATIIAKILTYEKEPITSVNWFTRALMLSVIQEYDGYFSARETVIAAGDKLLDFTYTIIDTFISPYQNSTSTLKNMINQGATFINYRGFGSPYYWSGGYGNMMDINDVENLNNGTLLPMVTSIVCGGGNFAYDQYPNSFGETWLNAGTPSNPKGAIAFIGPSEHDTKTQFNNTNDLGIYNGIAYEGIYGTAEMMLRGKMALYNSFPNGHQMDGYNDALDSDKFYFYTYNLLGDPGLKIWTDNPKEIEMSAEFQIDDTINNLEININSEVPEGTILSLTSDIDFFSSALVDASGNTTLVFPYLLAGEYTITASKYGYLPEEAMLTVTETSNITIQNIEVADCTNGATVTANITFHNKSTEAISDCEISVESTDEYVSVASTPELISIEAGGDLEFQTEISLGNTWRNNQVFNLIINLSYGAEEYQYIHQICSNSPEFTYSEIQVDNSMGYLNFGEENQFNLEFTNTGSIASGAVQIELTELSGNCEVTQTSADYAALEVDASTSGDNSFSANISSDVIEGEVLTLQANILVDQEVVSSCIFTVPVGNITENSPTFGANGYYAIESSDEGNFDAPVYDWKEIAPEQGGDGEEPLYVHTTVDGKVGWYELPFDFTYFGESYDAITVSTEGCLSMGKDDIVFFRNRYIPSGVGPKAMIAPFWDNLRNGDIYGYYNEEEHYFVVTWYDFINSSNYTEEEFQVLLFDPEFYDTDTGNGLILFQYKDINNCDTYDNYATIGIENELQTDGLLLSYADIYPNTMHELEDETAILITSGGFVQLDVEEEQILQHDIALYNYPNPFCLNSGIKQSITNICYNLPQSITDDKVVLKIFNIKGQRVWETEIDKAQGSANSVTWDGNDMSGKKVSTGVYLYKLETSDQVLDSNKMLILK